ncbi:MAG: NADH-quinone oxidoreductase subunit N [Gemmatimonadota bacterium]
MILDFSSQLHYLWALLPEVVLALTGLVILMADVFARGAGPGPSGRWVPTVAIAGLLGAGAAAVFLLGVDSPGRTGMIAVDGFRVALTLVIIGATIVSLLFSLEELERRGLAVGEFYFLVLMATVGMMLLTAARDLILVFVAVELMSISVYVLTGFDRKEPRSSEGALKYFLMGAFASAFLLYGIALVFGAVSSTNLALVGSQVAARAGEGSLLLQAGVALLVIGLAFKVSAVPFHMWTPDAYEGAPTPVTAFMAAGVKAAGFAAVLRIVVVGLAPAAEMWHGIIWWLALLTMIVPNLIALQEEDVKRMLAYSSIAHAGYLLVGVVAGSAMGISASIFYLGIYALMTVGSFAVVAVVAAGRTDADLGRFRGLGWSRPFLAALMVLCLLSLAGFPPTGGFIGKLYLLRAALGAGEVTLAVVLVMTSLVSYYYYLRVIWKMYFDAAPEGARLPPATGTAFRLAGLVAALGILLAGLYPGPGLEAADAAGRDIAGAASPAAAVATPASASPGAAAPAPSADPTQRPE